MNQKDQCDAITVYCSSSNHVDGVYLDAAYEMGELIAKNGYTLVFGGGRVGLMGAVSRGARKHNGQVVGIILRKFMDVGVADAKVREMLAVEDMRSRKQGLEEAGGAYIALPGGFGTFEEITEMISFKQLGFHTKPIVILNVNKYFDHLLNQFELGFQEKFIETRFREVYEVVDSPAEAMQFLETYQPPELDLKYRWPL
ncbi:TIGR00730 family Rossman fold protein [candidate division KSB1 bacterium]|nr:TIGR00730 family Rossman fold protein [candidate division KSB1 bacterium]NIR69231.1 TIGR00730 family Rossman fold protein [candidate division KSB1 bacterium]NIS27405.1 TIGR00730 family Rossman fold protein [candidate division KSB1 bacterium]NIT74230.1 TIGR00730 family Rossman fold protein [candidate division KSB1 bacterium]NIU28122.1 TIGR00730 family Rossman fold protein [candidate division KSB1 bacterium]